MSIVDATESYSSGCLMIPPYAVRRIANSEYVVILSSLWQIQYHFLAHSYRFNSQSGHIRSHDDRPHAS